MTIPDFSTADAMRDLLRRTVASAGKGSGNQVPRWSHVGSLLGHGSGYSYAICREFGADPDEPVGGLKDGVYCPSCGYCQDCLHHEYEEHGDDCEAPTEVSDE